MGSRNSSLFHGHFAVATKEAKFPPYRVATPFGIYFLDQNEEGGWMAYFSTPDEREMDLLGSDLFSLDEAIDRCNEHYLARCGR